MILDRLSLILLILVALLCKYHSLNLPCRFFMGIDDIAGYVKVVQLGFGFHFLQFEEPPSSMTWGK